jgi:hypothetical protein
MPVAGSPQDPAMTSIQPCPLPAHALLARYAGGGAYTDCYGLDVAGVVSQAAYVEAFYTGRSFKVELFLLGLIFAKPSTDSQARQLALGDLDAFSGWRVEDRSPDQLLMCDLGGGRTRSWLMTELRSDGSRPVTRLYFGSAVLPGAITARGEPRMGPLFAPLLWFHRFYSQVLLGAARAQLARGPSAAGTAKELT